MIIFKKKQKKTIHCTYFQTFLTLSNCTLFNCTHILFLICNLLNPANWPCLPSLHRRKHLVHILFALLFARFLHQIDFVHYGGKNVGVLFRKCFIVWNQLLHSNLRGSRYSPTFFQQSYSSRHMSANLVQAHRNKAESMGFRKLHSCFYI